MKRRHLVFLTGATLTSPAHQWLVHDPGPLVSGLAGRRVSVELADRFIAMSGELRTMDDVAAPAGMIAFPRNRQAYLTHQANALTRPGKHRDLEAAAARGVEAIQLAESLDSTHSVDLLRDLYRQMKPHGDVPAAADFLDRARGLAQV